MSPIPQLVALSALFYAIVVLVVVFVKRSPLVVWSVWLYRLLLTAYPTPFREEYGQAMVQVFHDTARAEHRRRGLRGLLVVWLWTLVDFSVSVVRQHREQSAAPASSEAVLLRDLWQQWRQFGAVAFSATTFSAWYGLHLLRLFFGRAVLVWATLTTLALGSWIWSFCDGIHVGRSRATRVEMGRGLVGIAHVDKEGEPISYEQWLRDREAWKENNPALYEHLQECLHTRPKPWEIRFVSDISGASVLQFKADRKTPAIVQPYREWHLIFPFFPLPLLLLLGTILAYRRRRTVSSPAMQSA
jgi:hypothetical protein